MPKMWFLRWLVVGGLIKLKIIILELYWTWGEYIDHNIIIYVIIIVVDILFKKNFLLMILLKPQNYLNKNLLKWDILELDLW